VSFGNAKVSRGGTAVDLRRRAARGAARRQRQRREQDDGPGTHAGADLRAPGSVAQGEVAAAIDGRAVRAVRVQGAR
jgi:hypothetical protein